MGLQNDFFIPELREFNTMDAPLIAELEQTSKTRSTAVDAVIDFTGGTMGKF